MAIFIDEKTENANWVKQTDDSLEAILQGLDKARADLDQARKLAATLRESAATEDGVWRTTKDGSKIFIADSGEVRAGGPAGPAISSATGGASGDPVRYAAEKMPQSWTTEKVELFDANNGELISVETADQARGFFDELLQLGMTPLDIEVQLSTEESRQAIERERERERAQRQADEDLARVSQKSTEPIAVEFGPPGEIEGRARPESRHSEGAVKSRMQALLQADSFEAAAEKAANLCGAPAGSKVTLTLGADKSEQGLYRPAKEPDGKEILVHIRNEELQMEAKRKLDFSGDAWVVSNVEFTLGKETQNRGIGFQVFSRQVEQLAAAGFVEIQTYAAQSERMNGYYTWPRLGYDVQFTEDERRSLSSAFGQDVEKVSDLMRTQAGRDFWKEEGYSRDMTFDLRPGSLSRYVLDEYKKRRK